MSALSNYMEAKIVDHFLRNTPVPSPATVYLALFEDDPGEGTGGTETSYTNYARQPSTWSEVDATGATKNTTAITFPPNGNPAAAVTLTHGALYDAPTGGNRLVYGPLTNSKTLENGDVLSFAANALIFTLD